MRPRTALLLATVPLLALLPSACAPFAPSSSGDPDALPPGFTALFDGESLDGWWGCSTQDPRVIQALSEERRAEKRASSLGNIREHWWVEDGLLRNDGEGLFLTTEREYGDFELHLEYRTVAGADSGIYLRGQPQVQIWDTTEAGGKWDIGAALGSGGLWNNLPGTAGRDPLVHADAPFGEWNRVRVTMVGERVSVWLNGTRVVDHARLGNYFERGWPIPRVGPIQLQTHGGEIDWRRVRIREIGPDEANEILAAADTEGIRPIFDASDLGGPTLEAWRGATDAVEVRDGGLTFRPGSGGTLYTAEEFGDFEVRFEFLLPPGGNNGLAIRYPGKGDTAYTGMCELQVLDDTADRYAELDPRQYHGSAYGMVPAHRGYLRAPGVWNHQRVRVVGSRIEVELNGTRILDTDLANVSEGMAPLEKYAGRTRTHGHFGFAGHGDPVSFRNVVVRRLDEAGTR